METFLWMPESEWRDEENKIRNRWTCGDILDKLENDRYSWKSKLLKNNSTP